MNKEKKPLLMAMIQASTPENAIAAVRNAVFDGEDSFGLQVESLDNAYRSMQNIRSILSVMGNRTVYVTNYRTSYNEGKNDDELAKGLLHLADCGADIIDVMGDMFCRDKFGMTYDENAVNEQKKLIRQIHYNGKSVLMSAHVPRFLSAEEVIQMAAAQQARGADIAKIVTVAETETEEMENLRITALLKHERDIPYLFLSIGSHCKIHRMLSPILGSFACLCVQSHDRASTKAQLVLSSAKAVLDNFDCMPDREF